MVKLPEKFCERYKDIVDDSEKFFSCLKCMPPKSFRVNTLKANIDEVVNRLKNYGLSIEQTKWYDEAFISQSLDIGDTFEHFIGNIYMQELASMVPPLILKDELIKAKTVLDACAAPGSKTTQMAAFMRNKGTLVANDDSYQRIRALKFNIEKMGVLNTVINNSDIRKVNSLKFDVILVDAPCSGEGTIRKSESAILNWSENQIESCAVLQKQILVNCYDMLREGGVLVYSTCTIAPEENELVIQDLLEKRNDASLEKISIDGFKITNAIDEWKKNKIDSSIKSAIRIWPHHNDTEGFFVAKVRK